ncbi:hypothetical protein IU470_28905 [Nocardia abscessus]|uniref:Uncharacterized protein n=1 Tax=Nocardia abscessus TaxID=120957 RepID=A0ABS0CFH8_9NOCA|nr:hypothetical protein [Nocardia abscessus]MBF6229099.1 hypothetical protein [Nocardia abscessus]
MESYSDRDLIAAIQQRRAELKDERAQLRARLEAIEAEAAQAPNPSLLDELPTGYIDVSEMPYELARQLVKALCSEIRYNKAHHSARYRITLTDHAVRSVNSSRR